MSFSKKLLKTLKQILKSRRLTYNHLAKEMGLSEATLKRIFSKGTFTLKRLEQVCQILDIEFYDLVKTSDDLSPKIAAAFDIEQEKSLAANSRLYTVFYLLISGLTPNQIIAKYRITELEIDSALLLLDKNRLIKLSSNRRVQLLVTKNVRWLKNGPLFKLYSSKIKNEFFESDFTRSNEYLRLHTICLTDKSLEIFSRRLDRLYSDLLEISETDSQTDLRQNRIWFLSAYRPWSMSEISKLKR